MIYCIEKNCNNKVSKQGNRCHSCANRLINLGRKRPDNITRNKKIFTGKSSWNKNKKLSKSHIKHMKQGQKGIKRSKKAKLNMTKARKKSWKNQEYRGKLSKERKERWNNKKYKNNWLKKISKKLHKKPNQIEKILYHLLQRLLPNEYKFVGNGEIILGGFNPDFINCNGQKKIIELYGDYWHNLPNYKKRDIRRLITYDRYSYKTLIIWEHELKNLDKVKNKILKFHYGDLL